MDYQIKETMLLGSRRIPSRYGMPLYVYLLPIKTKFELLIDHHVTYKAKHGRAYLNAKWGENNQLVVAANNHEQLRNLIGRYLIPLTKEQYDEL